MTSWNLQATNAGPGNAQLPEAAAAVKKLAPDVILLQGVRDWQSCDQLARALKPADYRVLVCSAFPGAQTNEPGSQQVAILARQRAYFAWSQAWKPDGASALPGGLAFAAIDVRGQRVGFFSVESWGEPLSTRQLLSQVSSIRQWVTNRLQVYVVAGALGKDTSRGLEAAGFGNVFLGVPAVEREPADYIFALPSGCATNAFISSGVGAGHYPVTCDLELDPARIAAGWAARIAAVSKPEAPARSEAIREPAMRGTSSGAHGPALSVLSISALVFVGALVVGAGVWRLARRSRKVPFGPRGLLAAEAGPGRETASSYTVVLGTQSGSSPVASEAGTAPTPARVIHMDALGTTHTEAEMLRQRAEAAEERAARATAALRRGVVSELSHWLKRKLLRKLITDRGELLETQQAATAKALTVEERLARVERQLQQQNQGYQQRIEELTRELLAAKEENRELIRAQIRQVKAEMEAARARLLAQADGDERQ